MPKLAKHTPMYRRHRGSDQAIVTLNGKDQSLGPWNSRTSRDSYDLLVGEWQVGGLRDVAGVKAARSDAGESEPVRPVPEGHVAEKPKHVSPQIAR